MNFEAVVSFGNDSLFIDEGLDSPTFLYIHSQKGYFVQFACPVNGGRILIHESYITFLDDSGNELDLFELDVKPIGV